MVKRTDAAAGAQSLEADLARAVRRVQVEIPEEIAAAEARIVEATSKGAEMTALLETRRAVRQQALVEGGDVTALRQEITEIQAELAETEDLRLGLQAKIRHLEAENMRLQSQDLPRIRREIFEAGIEPLVDEFNAAAARLAECIEAIWRRSIECGQAWGPGAVSSVWPSDNDWRALQTVPRLCRPGKVGPHFFSYPDFAYLVQQEHKPAA